MKYASQIPRETIARLEAMAAEDPVHFCQPISASRRTSPWSFPTKMRRNCSTASWHTRMTHNYRPQSAPSARKSLDIHIFDRYNVC